MKLEIHDKDGKVIESTNLEVTDGDILIFQYDEDKISHSKLTQTLEVVNRALKHCFENPNSLGGIAIPNSITIKVLKVRRE